jgi:bifunctional non-homologous end joining protein LigD
LKSWAVPKGAPSPEQKHLAIMVEDHPYEYRNFSGTIPAGHYGAGRVEIWDSGSYSVPGAQSLTQAQAIMRAAIKKGHINFFLHGERLNGEYVLIKTSLPGTKESWLWFMKGHHHDEMPTKISPMLAKIADDAFDKSNWLFEIKWDGYRALARIKANHAELISRNERSLSDQFALIARDLERYVDHDAILDGEIVVVDDHGNPSFQLMQNYRREKVGHLFYYVFDLLYLDGHDLRALPLIERKALLEQILAPLAKTRIRYSDHVAKTGKKFFKEAQKMGLEGIVAKDADSPYVMARSDAWLKIKTALRQEVVIGGFTKARGSRISFGALLLGVYDESGILHFVGNVGTGFSDETLVVLARKLRSLIRKKCPFNAMPTTNAEATFVKPELVCEVSFAEWTKDGRMRHPVFLGLRTDKEARDVRREL